MSCMLAGVLRNITKRSKCVKSSDIDLLALIMHYLPKMTNTSKLWFQIRIITNIK